MIFTTLSQLKWSQLLQYYDDFAHSFTFCVILSLLFIVISFHQISSQLSIYMKNNKSKSSYFAGISFLWGKLSAYIFPAKNAGKENKMRTEDESFQSTLFRTNSGISLMLEKITAIKEMATYAVSDFKYEAVPVTFKRKVDDIFVRVNSSIKWGQDNFSPNMKSWSSVDGFKYDPETLKRNVDELFDSVNSGIKWGQDKLSPTMKSWVPVDGIYSRRDQEDNASECKSTKFYYDHNERNERMVEKLKQVGDYVPPWWYNPHLGTIFSFGSDPRLRYHTELVAVQCTTIASTSSACSSRDNLSSSPSFFENPCSPTDDCPSPTDPSPIDLTLTPPRRHRDSDHNSSSTANLHRTTITESDSFNLDWYPCKPARPSDRSPVNVVVFFPGLGLSSKNNFAQKFARYMFESGGYYTVICGARGLDVPLKSDRFWHPGMSEDAVFVINYVWNSYGASANIFLTGFSAGSNIVQRALLSLRQQQREKGTEEDGPRVKAAVCVCITYDYMAARQRLEKSPVGALYSMLMAHMYKSIIQKNAHVHHLVHADSAQTASSSGGQLVQQLLSKATFLSDYDELCGRFLHKFSSQSQLQDALSMFQCAHIDVPLLAIQPEDDPLHAVCLL